MIDKKIEAAINDQINWELYSSYLYFSMAAYCDSVNLKGFSSWMRTQAMEEMTHVKRFYDFLTARGGRVILSDIKAPPTKWDNPHAVFKDTYHLLSYYFTKNGHIYEDDQVTGKKGIYFDILKRMEDEKGDPGKCNGLGRAHRLHHGGRADLDRRDTRSSAPSSRRGKNTAELVGEPVREPIAQGPRGVVMTVDQRHRAQQRTHLLRNVLFGRDRGIRPGSSTPRTTNEHEETTPACNDQLCPPSTPSSAPSSSP